MSYIEMVHLANIELFVRLLSLFIIALVYRSAWRHVYARTKDSTSILDTSFLQALHYPFYFLLLLFAISMVLPFIPGSLYKAIDKTPQHFEGIFSVGFTVFVLMVFNRFLSNIQSTIIRIEKNTVMENSQAWISACKLGRLVSILVFVLVTLSVFHVPMGQILAPTAVLAFAIPFAGKDILANVFGGVMVLCDRPFTVGDYVTIANNEEGTVRYIGWRVTQVQLRNGRILHVPNGLITTSTVTNYSEKTHWFVQKEIGLRYQDLEVAAEIAQALEDWINGHKLTNQRRVSFAKLYDLSDSSVIIRARVYLKSSINTKQWYAFTQELLLKTNALVKDKGADFAFPTRTVVMEKSEDITES
ncbi:mechanosensitive ion channel family protein [Candidatus Synchoanobacter obligatus]|uniref:Mechanosensitive ion channel family protein n=1 Tax=Candidatus Synchoanobacter obligatus TaxID=2919597 RepID=A0ABT1L604_9GAMM|nr:mechanosensitive ion channel family protein [Candidatus Synchoanobacter obligatus]MCP8352602.1 mechanosensitive ion channel family protein [Candidatus Synchoanobacter obligatus]